MGHWYDKEGNPQHFIDGRDTTLRDARKYGWAPSVTGILDTLDKPGLNRWRDGKIVTAAYEEAKLCASTGAIDEYPFFRDVIMENAFSETDDAVDVGSQIHADMEDLCNGKTNRLHHSEIAYAARDAIERYTYTNLTDFHAEMTVVGPEGYGGSVDLHNDKWLIDYKSKDITDDQWEHYQKFVDGKRKVGPKLAYPNHCMQLSAYDHALGGDRRDLLNVFIDRNEPGRVIIHHWQEYMWDRFYLLLQYWQLDKNYQPFGE